MGVPNPFPNTNLTSHNVRTPDTNPVVGGPYIQGYDPTATKTADSGRVAVLSLPSLQIPATNGNAFTPGAAIKTQAASGDQPGYAYSQVTEDHSE